MLHARFSKYVLTTFLVVGWAAGGAAQEPQDDAPNGRSPVHRNGQRRDRGNDGGDRDRGRNERSAEFPRDVRAIDGSNGARRERGAAEIELIRRVRAA